MAKNRKPAHSAVDLDNVPAFVSHPERAKRKSKVAYCNSLLPMVENIQNAAWGVHGIGEALVDSGVRKASEGSKPFTPMVIGCLEAGLIALAEFMEGEVEALQRRIEKIEEVERD